MARSIPRTLTLFALISVLAVPAGAERLGKGRSLVLIGVGGHRGQFTFPGGADFRLESGEVGGDITYQRFLTDHWTLGVTGGYHFSRLDPDPSVPPFGIDKLETSSFTARLGGDRYAFIDDDVALYAGPGVVFTRGRAKDSTADGPDATEIGLNGRLGMYARLRRGAALFGHIGQVLSHTSAKHDTEKLSWWTSTHEGSVGLAFDF